MSLAGRDAVIRASRLTGAFLPIRKAGTITADGGGVIVTMSSVHELIPLARVHPLNLQQRHG